MCPVKTSTVTKLAPARRAPLAPAGSRTRGTGRATRTGYLERVMATTTAYPHLFEISITLTFTAGYLMRVIDTAIVHSRLFEFLTTLTSEHCMVSRVVCRVYTFLPRREHSTIVEGQRLGTAHIMERTCSRLPFLVRNCAKHVADSSNHLLYLIKLFSSSSPPEGSCGGNQQ